MERSRQVSITRNTPMQPWFARSGSYWFCAALTLFVCSVGSVRAEGVSPGLPNIDRPEGTIVHMTVNNRRFSISLADTAAANEFAEMLPLSIEMDDLNRNEKHAELPRALPTNASRPGTIREGDIMLYGSKTLVVFCKTFDSTYSYTRLGRVDDAQDIAQALGDGDIQIAFSQH